MIGDQSANIGVGIGFTTNGIPYEITDEAPSPLLVQAVNTNNGALSPAMVGIGARVYPYAGYGMTATPNGTFYVYASASPEAEEMSLYTIQTNSVVTEVGSLGYFTFRTFGGGFTSDAAGRLYITIGETSEKLYSVNSSTGAATLIGPTGSNAAWAIGFAGNTLYLVDIAGQVWTVNPATGAATHISTYGNTYGTITSLVMPPAQTPLLTITNLGAGLSQINWTAGVLQNAPNLNGPYTDLTNTTSPYFLSATNAQLFFRVHNP
jgi:hypothetical protein